MEDKQCQYSAIVLSAGRGHRIESITKDPKCLLTISGKSMLRRHIENFIAIGMPEIVLVVGYKKEKIVDHVRPYEKEISIRFTENNDYVSHGNAFSLFLGLQSCRYNPFIIDADVVCGYDMIKGIMDNPAQDCLAVGNGSLDDIECAKTLVDENGFARMMVDKRSVTEKELSRHGFAGEAVGIIKCSSEGKRNLIKTCERFFTYEKNLPLNWEHLMNMYFENFEMKVHHVQSDRWIEIDTPEDYKKAEKLYAELQRQ